MSTAYMMNETQFKEYIYSKFILTSEEEDEQDIVYFGINKDVDDVNECEWLFNFHWITYDQKDENGKELQGSIYNINTSSPLAGMLSFCCRDDDDDDDDESDSDSE